MATSASRSRLFPARSRKSYRLEMEGRTLYLLLSLMALTGVVIFYLGVVTGKALRDPNAPVALSANMGAPATPGEAAPKPEGLAFQNALKGDSTAVEGLRSEGQNAQQRTQALIDAAQKQLRLEEVPPSGAAKADAPGAVKAPAAATAAAPARPQAEQPAVPPPATPAAPRVTQPAAPSNATDDGALYTVQVFSSQREANARQLRDKLRSQGFSAYLNRYEAADKQVWYRVRVGRTDRAGAEDLQRRLRSEAKLKNPQIQKL